ncbi:MAG: hypothetical protein WCE23_06345 [Candidatus Binatus sp.]|uniref:hypothetical protein n=1 Tax=Candidatus Binatus sp. TaxID=2811406 RepID=UPI003C75B1BB
MNLVFEAGTADGATAGTADGATAGTVAMIGIMAYIATHMHSLADITLVAMRWLVGIHLAVVVRSVATGMPLQGMRVADTEAADMEAADMEEAGMVVVDCCE